MIDFYYAPTPNGHKITLFLEEAQLAYRLIRVDIGKGEQFHPQFLAISPNNKIRHICVVNYRTLPLMSKPAWQKTSFDGHGAAGWPGRAMTIARRMRCPKQCAWSVTSTSLSRSTSEVTSYKPQTRKHIS